MTNADRNDTIKWVQSRRRLNGLIMRWIVVAAGIASMLALYVQVRRSRLGTELLEVVAHGTVSQAKQLLAQGANIEARRRANPITIGDSVNDLTEKIERPEYPVELGYTPLMLACIRGDKVMVELLIREGADRGASEETLGRGPTPLSLAMTYHHPDLVPLLQQTSASNSPSSASNSP